MYIRFGFPGAAALSQRLFLGNKCLAMGIFHEKSLIWRSGGRTAFPCLNFGSVPVWTWGNSAAGAYPSRGFMNKFWKNEGG